MEQAKILVINDGSALFYGMAGLLESKGFRTKVTETAAEAPGTLSTCWFDLVIIKLHLGQTNRVALLPRIKELCPRAKLIIMSDPAIPPWRPMKWWLMTTSSVRAVPRNSGGRYLAALRK